MDFSITGLFKNINTSKYFAGVMMILLNLGSRYLALELSPNQEQLFNNIIIRRFIIFTITFIATRDVLVSLVLTCVFIVLVSNLFNENSEYCVLKNKKIYNQITKLDFEKAKSVIKLYELQNKN